MEMDDDIEKLKAVSTWNQLKSTSIWEHQFKAIKFLDSYLADPQKHDETALIRMPTGTGKTAIIAAVTNFQMDDLVLIVVTLHNSEHAKITRSFLHCQI